MQSLERAFVSGEILNAKEAMDLVCALAPVLPEGALSFFRVAEETVLRGRPSEEWSQFFQSEQFMSIFQGVGRYPSRFNLVGPESDDDDFDWDGLDPEKEGETAQGMLNLLGTIFHYDCEGALAILFEAWKWHDAEFISKFVVSDEVLSLLGPERAPRCKQLLAVYLIVKGLPVESKRHSELLAEFGLLDEATKYHSDAWQVAKKYHWDEW